VTSTGPPGLDPGGSWARWSEGLDVEVRVLALLAVAAALLLPTLVTVATAATPIARPNAATTTDTRHDVTYIRVVGDTVHPGGSVPTRTMGDLRIVRVNHNPSTVRIRTTFVDLNRTGTDHVYSIKTPKHSYAVDLYATTGAWGGSASIFNLNGTAQSAP
jgi:hypothetical protein